MATDGGKFPDFASRLKFFQTSFNREEAKKAGVVVPSLGVNKQYDAAILQIKASESELEQYLTRQRKKLGCKVEHPPLLPNTHTLAIASNTLHRT